MDGSEQPIRTALPNQKGLVPDEDASIYTAQGNQFDIAVGISEYIARYGAGVYTIQNNPCRESYFAHFHGPQLTP